MPLIRTVLAIVLVLWTCSAGARTRKKQSVDLEFAARAVRIDAAMRAVGDANPALSRLAQTTRRVSQPYFVFVPGILGSRLYAKRGAREHEVFGHAGLTG